MEVVRSTIGSYQTNPVAWVDVRAYEKVYSVEIFLRMDGESEAVPHGVCIPLLLRKLSRNDVSEMCNLANRHYKNLAWGI